jgi:hypothetical protein
MTVERRISALMSNATWRVSCLAQCLHADQLVRLREFLALCFTVFLCAPVNVLTRESDDTSDDARVMQPAGRTSRAAFAVN